MPMMNSDCQCRMHWRVAHKLTSVLPRVLWSLNRFLETTIGPIPGILRNYSIIPCCWFCAWTLVLGAWLWSFYHSSADLPLMRFPALFLQVVSGELVLVFFVDNLLVVQISAFIPDLVDASSVRVLKSSENNLWKCYLKFSDVNDWIFSKELPQKSGSKGISYLVHDSFPKKLFQSEGALLKFPKQKCQTTGCKQ